MADAASSGSGGGGGGGSEEAADSVPTLPRASSSLTSNGSDSRPRASRAPSILISPRPTASSKENGASGAGGGAGGSLNSLATQGPSADKLLLLEALAPKEGDQLQYFDKTLKSDISAEEAVVLLQRVDEKTSLFREFTFSDMVYLARVLTILKFEPGDLIIQEGEEASFVGLVLSGELQVKFGSVCKPVPEGSLLGELSFFEGGTRTAAVSAATPAVLGIITVNELELLADYAPSIRLKLMVLFALEGIKKMRQMNKPAPAAANAQSEEKKEEKSDASDKAAASSKRSSQPMLESSSSDGKLAGAEHGRNRSVRRAASLLKGEMSLPPGTLKGEAAAASDSSTSPTPLPAGTPPEGSVPSGSSKPTGPTARHVEALFRIRMASQQKEQQAKIEAALAKRKKAEHRAHTTNVLADAFRRDAEKKQEWIEELYQENEDLKDYKAWAQKKHIADARFLKEKLETLHSLQVQLGVETEKRKAQEKANEELYSKLDSMVAARTKSYVETIDEQAADLKRLQTRLDASDKLRATLEENLRLATERHKLDESRLADSVKAVEEVRVETAQAANEQVVLVQRSLYAAQDEVAILRRTQRELEERVLALQGWKEQAVEREVAREMLQSRLQRSLVEQAERAGSLAHDVASYRCVLKVLLVSVYVKAWKRRRALAALYVEHVDLLRKLNSEVAHYKAVQGAVAREDNADLVVLDDVELSGSGGADEAQGLRNGALVPHSATAAAIASSGHASMRAAREFAARAKIDPLFQRINDLLPSLRSLADEISTQKIYWNSTADSFFQRTIELKKQLMELEARTGVKAAGSSGKESNGGSTPRESDVPQRSNPSFIYLGDESKEQTPSDAKGSTQRSARALRASDDEEDVENAPQNGLSVTSKHNKGSTAVIRRTSDDQQSGPGGSASVRDLRDRVAFYKRRVKEFKETNAMLNTKLVATSARLAEIEDWQRSLYAHTTAATSVGLVGPFSPHSAAPMLSSSAPVPLSMSMSAPVHQAGLVAPLPPVAGASPPPGAAPGSSRTHRATASFSASMAASDNSSVDSLASPLRHNGSMNGTLLSPAPPSGAKRDSTTAANGAVATSSTPNGPLFQIKGGVNSSTAASPLTALYASLPTSSSSSTPLKRGGAESNGSFVISTAPRDAQPIYTLNTRSGENRGATASPLHGNAAGSGYMQYQMAATGGAGGGRFGSGAAAPSMPMLVFPPSTPSPLGGSTRGYTSARAGNTARATVN